MGIFVKDNEHDSEYFMYDLKKRKMYYLCVSAIFWRESKPVLFIKARVSDYPYKELPVNPTIYKGSLTTYFINKDLLMFTDAELRKFTSSFPVVLRDRAFKYTIPVLYKNYKRLKSNRFKSLLSDYDYFAEASAILDDTVV